MLKKRVFKTKSFAKWMKKNGVQKQDLLTATQEMSMGLIEADLGCHVYKKRIGMSGSGKRSGARIIVATQLMSRWFFIYGFAKNEKSNVSKEELLYLQEVAKRLLDLKEREIEIAINANELKELMADET
ncbi:type II toxin-antitoxin system RelE/ParE family toxin [Polynucleobacter necessarius]|uniref:type II toxin-antitoxin system RelE/ParE family toxin n=1 Tax=Polynucleobacter necessarius TaxID=576610 RepID=UPI000E095A5C|nr:type II toxin-antitoxin system RelE/ParE family toxin [Polynucleobacter necessarius]